MSLAKVYGEESKAVQDTLTEMYQRENDFRDTCLAEADTEHAYKIAKAKAYLTAEGTEKAREAQSVVDTDVLLNEYLQAKARKEFTKEKIKDVQNALTARQSLLSASVKADSIYAADRRVT